MLSLFKHLNRQRQLECNRQRGAALLFALLIAIMISLTFFFKSANTATSGYAREQGTEEALVQAKAALIGYAATYRDEHPNEVFGYLLCPDTNNDGVAELVCGVAGVTMIGRLPYKTLGLSDLRATGGECLWYIVSGSHKYNPKTAPLNWDTRGQIRVQDNVGNALIDPNDASGGAVAVILAPSFPLNGQNRPTGTFNCSGDATNSIASYLDGGYAAATVGTLAVVGGQPGSSVNNDRLTWISARELFIPIARRSDLLGLLLAQLTSCLNLTYAQHIPTVNKSAAGAKWVSPAAGVDEVMPVLTALGIPACDLNDPAKAAIKAAWTNWKDHFQYIVCNPASSNCIQVNGVPCSGAILFGGRIAGGNPRSAAEKLDLASYFDAGNTTSLTTPVNIFMGNPLYSATTPENDVAICLQPRP